MAREDEPFAYSAREFLRTLVVGKEVAFTITHTVANQNQSVGPVSNTCCFIPCFCRRGRAKSRADLPARKGVRKCPDGTCWSRTATTGGCCFDRWCWMGQSTRWSRGGRGSCSVSLASLCLFSRTRCRKHAPADAFSRLGAEEAKRRENLKAIEAQAQAEGKGVWTEEPENVSQRF